MREDVDMSVDMDIECVVDILNHVVHKLSSTDISVTRLCYVGRVELLLTCLIYV